MKNKELIDTLEKCKSKELSENIKEYLSFIDSYSERGIQESLDELLEVEGYLIDKKLYQSYNSYTEIGSAEGGSLWIYSNLLLRPNSVINIIEINIRPALLETKKQLESRGHTVNIFTENSDKTAEIIRSTDSLFIDGDHSYLGVKKDFETYYPIVAKDGLCILHDTTSFPGCIRLKNELKARFSNIQTFSGKNCLHTKLDSFTKTQKACIEKGHWDFFYKELETGTTVILKDTV